MDTLKKLAAWTKTPLVLPRGWLLIVLAVLGLAIICAARAGGPNVWALVSNGIVALIAAISSDVGCRFASASRNSTAAARDSHAP